MGKHHNPESLASIGRRIPGHSKIAGLYHKSACSNFLEIYDRYFTPFRQQKIKLLEIGVSKGGSLKIWKEYFSQAKIYAIDITADAVQYQEQNIEIFIGDQEDQKFLNELAQRVGPFDIVIDDGGHHQKQQIASLKYLWQYVNKGGLYIVEDLCTAYWDLWGGGYEKPDTTIAFLSKLINNLNYLHTIHTHEWPTYKNYLEDLNNPRVLQSAKAKEEVPGINGTLSYLHFYDALAILGKI